MTTQEDFLILCNWVCETLQWTEKGIRWRCTPVNKSV